MAARTYTIQIGSPSGGYEANSLTLEGDGPCGTLGDFMGSPLFLGKSIPGHNGIAFESICGTICGDYRVRIDAVLEGEKIRGRLRCAMGDFPFTGELRG